MGSAASLNEYNLDAQIQNRYRQEIASLFVEEFLRLKNTKGVTKDDLCHEFIDVLQEKEPAILTKIGLGSASSHNSHHHHGGGSGGNNSNSHRNGGHGGGGNGSQHNNSNSSSTLDEETEFRQLCVDTVDKIRLKNTMVYLCCVDGSNNADLAFRTMIRLKKRLDHINLFHAYSKSKNISFLNSDHEEYHSDRIKQHYEEELISTYRIPVNRFHLDWIERKQNKSVIDIFQNILNDYQHIPSSGSGSASGSGSSPSAAASSSSSSSSSSSTGVTTTSPQPHFLFVGYVGRKSNPKKQNDKDDDGTIMGSFTEYCVYHAYMPTIICKTLCPLTQRLFILAVDGSPLCKRGFDICLTLINPKDSLRIINVYNPRKTSTTGCEPPPEEIEEFYNHEIESFGPYDSTFTTITCPVGSSIASCLVEFSNNVGGDFIILSPRTRSYMSATVEHVITHSHASIILCKN